MDAFCFDAMAQAYITLVVNAGSIWEFVCLKVDLSFGLVLVVNKFSHNFSVHRTTERIEKKRNEQT